MAKYRLFEGNRETFSTVWLAEEYGLQTSTTFEVLDSSTHNVRQVFYGTGFQYSGFFYTGHIDRMDFFGYSGKLVAEVDNVDISVETYRDALTVGRSSDNLYQIILRGNDELYGSSGNDSLSGSAGSDRIDGGLGIDVLTFQPYDGSVRIDLAARTAITSTGRSIVTNIEDIAGSVYGDTLIGDTKNNEIQGLAGNDVIDGGGGIDTAVYREASSAISVDLSRGTVGGGSGLDTLRNIENIIGSRFADYIKGNSGNNAVDGGLGNDRFDGSAGFDTVVYSIAPRSVIVNLKAGTAQGGFGTDGLVSIEGVVGSAFDDSIIGSDGFNVLNGGSGNDNLNGWLGSDRLYGGSGRDSFNFNTALSVTNVDHIVDFSPIDDTIRLENAIFTQLAAGGLTESVFKDITSPSARLDANDRILYNRTTGSLSYDSDGSGATRAVEFAIIDNKPLLSFQDFLVT